MGRRGMLRALQLTCDATIAAEPKEDIVSQPVRSLFVYGTLRPDCHLRGDVWGAIEGAKARVGKVTGFRSRD